MSLGEGHWGHKRRGGDSQDTSIERQFTPSRIQSKMFEISKSSSETDKNTEMLSGIPHWKQRFKLILSSSLQDFITKQIYLLSKHTHSLRIKKHRCSLSSILVQLTVLTPGIEAVSCDEFMQCLYYVCSFSMHELSYVIFLYIRACIHVYAGVKSLSLKALS